MFTPLTNRAVNETLYKLPKIIRPFDEMIFIKLIHVLSYCFAKNQRAERWIEYSVNSVHPTNLHTDSPIGRKESHLESVVWIFIVVECVWVCWLWRVEWLFCLLANKWKMCILVHRPRPKMHFGSHTIC